MDSLVEILLNGKKVVFVTGPGLGIASGIPPYRGTSNTLWDSFVVGWLTRRKFLENPLEWWNKFWLTAHGMPKYTRSKPNRGHEAIAHICRRCPSARVVTQNIDGLHSYDADAGIEDRLVEVHGRMSLFKCINPKCLKRNEPVELDPKRFDHRWKPRNIREERTTGLAVDLLKRSPRKRTRTRRFADRENQKESESPSPTKNSEWWERSVSQYHYKSAPVCPHCNHPVLPNVLMLDEDYRSHPYFQYDHALRWLKSADAIVFVGTSFSAGVTCDALEKAASDFKPVFNMSSKREDALAKVSETRGHAEATRIINALRIINIDGHVEQSLCMLAWALDHAAQMHGALYAAKIPPPRSPGRRLLAQPSRRSLPLTDFAKLPAWTTFACLEEHVNMRHMLHDRKLYETRSLVPHPFPLSSSDNEGDEPGENGSMTPGNVQDELGVVTILHEMGRSGGRSGTTTPSKSRRRRSRSSPKKSSTRRRLKSKEMTRSPAQASAKSRRGRKSKKPPRYPKAGGKRGAERTSHDDHVVVAVPWNRLPEYVAERLQGGRKTKRSLTRDSSDADVSSVSYEVRQQRWTPQSNAMSSSAKNSSTTRGGFMLSSTDSLSTPTRKVHSTPGSVDASSDAASILAMLNTPRINGRA